MSGDQLKHRHQAIPLLSEAQQQAISCVILRIFDLFFVFFLGSGPFEQFVSMEDCWGSGLPAGQQAAAPLCAARPFQDALMTSTSDSCNPCCVSSCCNVSCTEHKNQVEQPATAWHALWGADHLHSGLFQILLREEVV